MLLENNADVSDSKSSIRNKSLFLNNYILIENKLAKCNTGFISCQEIIFGGDTNSK